MLTFIWFNIGTISRTSSSLSLISFTWKQMDEETSHPPIHRGRMSSGGGGGLDVMCNKTRFYSEINLHVTLD